MFLEVSSVSGSFCRSPFVGCENCGESYLWWVYHKEFIENFLCLRGKIREGALLLFLRVSGIEDICKTGYHDFSSKIPWPDSTEKNHSGNLLCCVSETFFRRKTLCIFRRKFIVS